MSKKAKDTTLEQDIEARIAELEGQQLSRAQAIQPTLSHLEEVMAKAAPSIRVRSAKDFSSIARAHESLTKTQRLCAGMNTDKQEHSGSVSLSVEVMDYSKQVRPKDGSGI